MLQDSVTRVESQVHKGWFTESRLHPCLPNNVTWVESQIHYYTLHADNVTASELDHQLQQAAAATQMNHTAQSTYFSTETGKHACWSAALCL